MNETELRENNLFYEGIYCMVLVALLNYFLLTAGGLGGTSGISIMEGGEGV